MQFARRIIFSQADSRQRPHVLHRQLVADVARRINPDGRRAVSFQPGVDRRALDRRLRRIADDASPPSDDPAVDEDDGTDDE